MATFDEILGLVHGLQADNALENFIMGSGAHQVRGGGLADVLGADGANPAVAAPAALPPVQPGPSSLQGAQSSIGPPVMQSPALASGPSQIEARAQAIRDEFFRIFQERSEQTKEEPKKLGFWHSMLMQANPGMRRNYMQQLHEQKNRGPLGLQDLSGLLEVFQGPEPAAPQIPEQLTGFPRFERDPVTGDVRKIQGLPEPEAEAPEALQGKDRYLKVEGGLRDLGDLDENGVPRFIKNPSSDPKTGGISKGTHLSFLNAGINPVEPGDPDYGRGQAYIAQRGNKLDERLQTEGRKRYRTAYTQYLDKVVRIGSPTPAQVKAAGWVAARQMRDYLNQFGIGTEDQGAEEELEIIRAERAYELMKTFKLDREKAGAQAIREIR